jgi:short-subunit dehydrogenase
MSTPVKKEKIFIVGTRRGFGQELIKQWREHFPEDALAGSSRREFTAPGAETFVFDMSVTTQVNELLKVFESYGPTKVFYVAGGGPYGDFAEKNWKDHLWALQVSLLSPLQVLHFCLKLPSVQQVVLVGSAIAESQPDPGAASYAAAKHGLKGCVSSLQGETSKDVRLFSPGYMSTDMLPAEAQAQLRPKAPIDSPDLMAKLFIDWVQNPKASWHWEGRPTP